MELKRLKISSDMEIAADVGGDADRPPVILIHGGGQTRHAWGDTARRLVEAGFHVISMDMRGHGDSQWSASGAYHVDDFAADVGSIVRMQDRPTAVVGASLGGIAGLLAAGVDPARSISCLVLVDVTPTLHRAGTDRITQFMRSYTDGFDSIDEVVDVIAAYLPDRKKKPSATGLEKNLRERDGRFYWHWDPAFMDVGDHNDLIQEASSKMRRLAAEITIPTLLIRGRLSDVVTLEEVEELKQLIPHSETVDVSGAGHMVAGDKNDRFSHAAIEFLQRQHL